MRSDFLPACCPACGGYGCTKDHYGAPAPQAKKSLCGNVSTQESVAPSDDNHHTEALRRAFHFTTNDI
jgi:hypothetical protein